MFQSSMASRVGSSDACLQHAVPSLTQVQPSILSSQTLHYDFTLNLFWAAKYMYPVFAGLVCSYIARFLLGWYMGLLNCQPITDCKHVYWRKNTPVRYSTSIHYDNCHVFITYIIVWKNSEQKLFFISSGMCMTLVTLFRKYTNNRATIAHRERSNSVPCIIILNDL